MLLLELGSGRKRLLLGLAVTAFISALLAPAGAATEQTVLVKPVAATFVSSARPNANLEGGALLARARPGRQSLVRFRLSRLPSDAIVKSATLSFAVLSSGASSEPGEVHDVAGPWSPTRVTWSTRPAVGRKVADISGPAVAGTRVSADVTRRIAGNGTFDFYLTSSSRDGVGYGGLATAVDAPALSVTLSTKKIKKPRPPQPSPWPTPIPTPSPTTPSPSPTTPPPPTADPGVKAFPSAEGFGRDAVGGRGGRVIEVTNLNDSGPGSLRAALEASGPRIVVFRTSGTIELLNRIKVTNPYLTIAGQTAPGGGITIKASPTFSSGPIKFEETHDVIVRHIRVRSGPSNIVSAGRDGIGIQASYNIILDHVSVSWATDENVGIIDGAHDITIQWSVISEGLSHSTHPEGEHSKGLSISGKNYLTTEPTGDVSVTHNLFAHNRNRNPQHAAQGIVDVVNNVVYDYELGFHAHDVVAENPGNVVNNFFKEGPSSSGLYEIVAGGTDTGLGAKLYVSGNIGPHRTSDSQPQDAVVAPQDRSYLWATRLPAPLVTELSAAQAYEDVLARAGATSPGRDPVDVRVIAEVRNGSGRIIDDPSEVGGWPTLAGGAPPADSDHDGMADGWETAHGLDPNDPSDGARVASNGYTNVENYLNELAGDAV